MARRSVGHAWSLPRRTALAHHQLRLRLPAHRPRSPDSAAREAGQRHCRPARLSSPPRAARQAPEREVHRSFPGGSATGYKRSLGGRVASSFSLISRFITASGTSRRPPYSLSRGTWQISAPSPLLREQALVLNSAAGRRCGDEQPTLLQDPESAKRSRLLNAKPTPHRERH
jgi:hypothetical protein